MWQAATQRCQQALKESADSYEQVLAQYTALKETVNAGAKGRDQTGEPDDAQNYVLVLIDAHSHTVCLEPSYGGRRLTARNSLETPFCAVQLRRTLLKVLSPIF